MKLSDKRFIILIVSISVSGFSQGLLLPLLAVLLEKQGISATSNGLSATALYVGMLVASPFMEAPTRRYGYKTMIIFGMSLVIGSVLLFPVFVNFYFWIVLRFVVGIGDTVIHFATQVWITSTIEPSLRGRSISLYGLSYGVGFGVGPLGLLLLPFGLFVPFIVATLLFLLVLFLILRLTNERPVSSEASSANKRYLRVFTLVGFALMPMLIYGFLESTLNNSFPIYGLRTGITEGQVSMLLFAFVSGSLILQFPLGYISDLIGRKKVLTIVTICGGLLFFAVPFAETVFQLSVIFIITGAMLGSIFSLGLAYVADLLPKGLLPTANIIGGILFGVGSIIGPYFGGIIIAWINPESLFIYLALVVLSFPLLLSIESLFRDKKSLLPDS